ncbi:hypothetical protein GCM10019815_18820 [Pediococcus damnosus]|nr:hypothetical protein BSQ38_09775 [Pediococcus damnosus]PIO84539.1 hypothetical protein BSQ37_00635 [Pediococcus damnosus]PJE48563.1 hypothetical protein BSQ36_00585 [Pediococcus damnosus]GEA92173.1 hypothetical protein PDA01_00660 [Pediococcus damnosus]
MTTLRLVVTLIDRAHKNIGFIKGQRVLDDVCDHARDKLKLRSIQSILVAQRLILVIYRALASSRRDARYDYRCRTEH